jgi:hypothetical protein
MGANWILDPKSSREKEKILGESDKAAVTKQVRCRRSIIAFRTSRGIEFSVCAVLSTYTATDEQTQACESCIISMISMRLEKLRQADLNLLVTFAAIAEEKSITAAASRLLLSQPAVSRALQRARAMFQDDLLIRSGEWL